MQEVVQPLALGSGHQGGQHREGLVVLAGQQQADQVLAERLARSAPTEQVIELGAELVDSLDRRASGLARRNHPPPPLEPDRPSLPPDLPRPEVTNQRLVAQERLTAGQQRAGMNGGGAQGRPKTRR